MKPVLLTTTKTTKNILMKKIKLNKNKINNKLKRKQI